MLCEKPFTAGLRAYPCGRCMPCLLNRRRIWTHRICLEATMKTDNAFVTLTYDDLHLPRVGISEQRQLPELRPKQLQDWLKRLRAAIQPLRIRFYAVGEYGDENGRPHYHAALFGFPTCVHGRTRKNVRTGEPDWSRCCAQCRMVGNTWGKGNVDLGTVDVGSAQYLAQYVTKKMTHRDHTWLEGREPEFSRMSLRPGIGADFMHEVASDFMKFNLEETQADVPSALRHGARALPLGRYLRRRLRKLIGREEGAPQEEIARYELEMLPLLQAAQADPDNPSLKGQIIRANLQKVLSMKAKAKIFKQRKTF